MPDISMCKRIQDTGPIKEKCPQRHQCYRFTAELAKGAEEHQCYFTDLPGKQIGNRWHCEFFWPVDETNKPFHGRPPKLSPSRRKLFIDKLYQQTKGE